MLIELDILPHCFQGYPIGISSISLKECVLSIQNTNNLVIQNDQMLWGLAIFP